MTNVWLREGTGFHCKLCGGKITKHQAQINFRVRRWGSAVVHSNPKDCINYRQLKSTDIKKGQYHYVY